VKLGILMAMTSTPKQNAPLISNRPASKPLAAVSRYENTGREASSSWHGEWTNPDMEYT
jgi:hypothetical protein